MTQNTLRGIDVSHHQNGINLANVDAEFVILKATEGNGYVDPNLTVFNDRVKALGRLSGFYHFARPDLNNSAQAEADWFVKTVTPLLRDDTILVLDWEAKAPAYGVTWARLWLERVHDRTGVKPFIYINRWTLNNYAWGEVATAGYPLWLAEYGANTGGSHRSIAPPPVKHWGTPTILQYTDKGRLVGYNGNLDLDIAYTNAAGWRKLAGGENVAATSKMVSPLKGYLTQPFKRINGVLRHAGMDIGSGGVAGAPVYAAFAGTVTKVVKGYKHGNRASTWAPGRTSNGVVVRNVGKGSSGDREYQGYGHVTAVSNLRVGDVVQAGDLIGHLDNSGRWTGWHLHFEMWTASGRAYDPQLAFNRWGIKVGSKPKANSKPKPKPVKPKPKPPITGSAKHREWQKRQNKYGNAGLYVDGVNGKVSKAWKKWTKDNPQRYLPAWRGVPKLVRDGDYAAKTHNAAKIMQRNNGLVVDGFIDRISINYMRKHGSPLAYRPSNRP